MTKKEFQEKYTVYNGTDECMPVDNCIVKTREILDKSFLDADIKSVLSQLNEHYIKTLRDLENAIFELCD